MSSVVNQNYQSCLTLLPSFQLSDTDNGANQISVEMLDSLYKFHSCYDPSAFQNLLPGITNILVVPDSLHQLLDSFTWFNELQLQHLLSHNAIEHLSRDRIAALIF